MLRRSGPLAALAVIALAACGGREPDDADGELAGGGADGLLGAIDGDALVVGLPVVPVLEDVDLGQEEHGQADEAEEVREDPVREHLEDRDQRDEAGERHRTEHPLPRRRRVDRAPMSTTRRSERRPRQLEVGMGLVVGHQDAVAVDLDDPREPYTQLLVASILPT